MYHRSQISSLPFERRLRSEGGKNWSFGEIFVLFCLHVGERGSRSDRLLALFILSLSPGHLKLQMLRQVLHIMYVRKTTHSISACRILQQVTLCYWHE